MANRAPRRRKGIIDPIAIRIFPPRVLLALDDLLEPSARRTRSDADAGQGLKASGQIGGQQTGTHEEIPTAAFRIEPQGEPGQRRQGPVHGRGSPEMQAQRDPPPLRVIAHQLQSALRGTGDEA